MMFVNDQSTENVCFCMKKCRKMQYIQLVYSGGTETGVLRDSDPGEGVALRGEVPYIYAYTLRYYIHGMSYGC